MLPLAAAAQSQGKLSPDRLQRIDQFMQRSIDSGEIAGAVTLVAQNGRIVHLKAHGLADLAGRKPMRNNSIFRIASMTKPVAGVSVLMLVEEGKVRLTDPVSRFLPSFKKQMVAIRRPPPVAAPGAPPPPPAAPPAPGTPPDYYTVPADREITVLDLLTHTSGLMSGAMGNSAGQKAFESRHTAGLKWVDELGSTPLEFQPGARWAYSPVAGFDVLARIVEVASGQDFNTFTRERLFKPLGMTETFFWPADAQRERLATVYVKGPGGSLDLYGTPDSMSSSTYFSGGGGLMSTSESYARFAMMLANGGSYNGQQILGKRMVELLSSVHIPDTLPGRPPGEGYGLSMRVVSDSAARRTLLSDGSFGWSGAYATHFWVDPKEKLVAIVMAQRWGYQAGAEPFETAVMQALVD